MLDIAQSVGLHLGVPFAAGFLTRRTLLSSRGREWCESRFAPRLGPLTLIALLFTIVVMFALQGHAIVELQLDVLRTAAPPSPR